MVQGRKVDPPTRKKIFRLKTEGHTYADIARIVNLNYSTVYQLCKGVGKQTGAGHNRLTERSQDRLPMPKTYDELGVEAKKALDDIVYFARRYFGAILLPWQKDATEQILKWFHTEDREYVCVNAPPGSGKSFFFTRILPTWLTVRNRAIRGMIGSASHTTAERYVIQIRRELERTVPRENPANEKDLGISVDAESTIPRDFGFFKPTNGDVWRNNAFVVAQPNDVAVSEKEPTWSAVGPDTAFIGGRFEFIIWDDLWDPAKLRSAEGVERLKDWYSEVAETRLEPGGLMILQGQRFSADDIYRYALDQTMGGDAALFDPDELPEGYDSDAPRYHHLKYKAHYDEVCGDRRHSKKQAPWPESCLLAPRRLPYTELAAKKANRGDQFEVVYQQEDVDPADVLVPKLWIHGGQDAKGVYYPGCLDRDREACELPSGLHGDLLSVVTADPSPTEFWAVQWWIVRIDNGEPQQRYLMDMHRGKMGANAFLDWDQSTQSFVGLAEEWQTRSQQLGWPITHWIVEKNAAQRFILQFEHVKRWQARHNVEVIGHETHKNKSDPEFGIWCVQAPYRHGLVRLFDGLRTRIYKQQLVHELTRWNGDKIGTDDCVMANWFLEWWLPQLTISQNSRPAVMWRPSWLKAEAQRARRGRHASSVV